MIRRAIIGLALFLAAAVFAAASAAAVYTYRHYVVHLAAVDAIIRELPREEAFPPETVANTISRLATPGLNWSVARNLVSELYPQPIRMLDWHLRGFLWERLLPHHLTRAEMLGLYFHFMPFEGGRGLAYGARHYYGKAPNELTQREGLELFVISQSPRGYSPTENPKRFREAVERAVARLGAPEA